MDLAQHKTLRTLFVRQQLTLMINRYEIMAGYDGGDLLAFAEQERLAFKEQVTLYADDGKQQTLCGFKAQQVIDLGATYDVTDANGSPIGSFRKDFKRSLLRSTWHLDHPGLGVITGQERLVMGLARRVFSSLKWWPYHFDFVLDGQPAFSVLKEWGTPWQIRDTYTVEIHHPDLDRRLVMAMAVALDALQGR